MSRRLVAAGLLAVGMSFTPTPAHAETWSGDDATGDAQAQEYQPGDHCSGPDVTSDAAPGEDITRMNVVHRTRKLVVGLHYAAPATTTDRQFTLQVRIPEGSLSVSVYRDHGWKFYVAGEPDWSQEAVDDDGDGVTDCMAWFGVAYSGGLCHGGKITLTDRVVTIAVPRWCINHPRWVEVGATSEGMADGVRIRDEWGTSEYSTDPRVITYGDRVRVSPGGAA